MRGTYGLALPFELNLRSARSSILSRNGHGRAGRASTICRMNRWGRRRCPTPPKPATA